MRKVVLLAALVLALPIAVFADSDFSDLGTIGTTATVSTLTPVAGGTLSLTVAVVGGGTVSLTTGTLTATAIAGTFSFTGGSFTITGPSSNTIFSGTFTTGSMLSVAPSGAINIFGVMGKNTTSQLIALGKVSGDTILTPEPGTLGLLGTGLVGIAGIVRRRFKAASS